MARCNIVGGQERYVDLSPCCRTHKSSSVQYFFSPIIIFRLLSPNCNRGEPQGQRSYGYLMNRLGPPLKIDVVTKSPLCPSSRLLLELMVEVD